MNVATARRRADLRKQITSCQKCGLGRQLRQVPFRGPTPAPLAIVGEAPGKTEAREGKPFIGKAGVLLKKLVLGELGLDIDTDVFICNIASCRPCDTPTGPNRPPHPPEIRACNENLQAQLRLAAAPWVLLLGATALKAFRPDGLITRIHGRPFFVQGTYFMPTFHPAAALRDVTIERVISQDLERLAWLSLDHKMREAIANLEANGLAPKDIVYWPDDCEKCGKEVYRYTENGIPYCEKCWKRDITVKNIKTQKGLF